MGYFEKYGELLKSIADEADTIALRYFRADEVRVERKRDGTAVTQADRAAEQAMRSLIEARYPTHGILGEEFGVKESVPATSRAYGRLSSAREEASLARRRNLLCRPAAAPSRSPPAR